MQLVGAGKAADRQGATGVAGQVAEAAGIIAPYRADEAGRKRAGAGVKRCVGAIEAEGCECVSVGCAG